MQDVTNTTETIESQNPSFKPIIIWLWAVAGMVFIMAIIGAITRLTESGLSMVEWRPYIGMLPPLDAAEWQRVFDLYRATPEYKLVNAGMTLQAFEYIFFWEWLHRLWGQLIGIAYAVPLVIFAAIGKIRKPLVLPCIGLLVLGMGQGVMGWYMVESGLVDRPDVSHYRLAAHLSLAFVLFCCLIWVALKAKSLETQDFPSEATSYNQKQFSALKTWFYPMAVCLGITMVWGAFVAGLDAGKVYNTFPLMGSHLWPEDVFFLKPFWLNFFENHGAIQFMHRLLGISSLALVVIFWAKSKAQNIPFDVKKYANLLLLLVISQVCLGISTLLTHVWIPLAATHQAMAFIIAAQLTVLRFALIQASKKSGR